MVSLIIFGDKCTVVDYTWSIPCSGALPVGEFSECIHLFSIDYSRSFLSKVASYM